MNPKAKQFYKRYLEAHMRESKLLCLYNAYFVLYGKEAYSKIASVANVPEDTVRKAVETCREDFEGERTILSNLEMERISSHLEEL